MITFNDPKDIAPLCTVIDIRYNCYFSFKNTVYRKTNYITRGLIACIELREGNAGPSLQFIECNEIVLPLGSFNFFDFAITRTD